MLRLILVLFATLASVGAFAQSVNTNADLAITAIGTYPQGVWRTTYAAGIGSPLFFKPRTGTCPMPNGDDGGSCVNTIGNNSWVSVPNDGVANVQNFGANPNGANAPTTTAAIQAALTASKKVYVPQGTYALSDMVTMPAAGEMTCAGRTSTNFSIDVLTFNMGAQGAVKMPAASDGVSIVDCGFTFKQPNTSSRASINPYPPAIYAVGSTRFYLDRIRVNAGYTCLDASGNTGGSRIGIFECGALAQSNVILTNGALDFIHVDSIECWPYGITDKTNLMSGVYSDQTTNCASFGKVDGLSIDKIATLRANIIITDDFNTAVPININNISLDINAMFEVDRGFIQVGRIYYTHSGGSNPAIYVNGHGSNNRLTIDSIMPTVSADDCPVRIAGSGATLSINGGRVVHAGARFACFDDAATTSLLSIRNTFFSIAGSHAGCLLEGSAISSNSMVIQNNQSSTYTSGSGNIMCFQADVAPNTASGNSFPRWSHSLPFSTSNGYYDIAEPFSPGAVTPAFITMGNFAPTYGSQEGWYYRRGSFVELGIYSVFNTNAYTTASGNFFLTSASGWPSPKDGSGAREPCQIGNMEKVTVSSQSVANIYDSSHIYFRYFSSAAASTFFNTSHVPASTSNVRFTVRCDYRVR
jgi:hypothetical protein